MTEGLFAEVWGNSNMFYHVSLDELELFLNIDSNQSEVMYVRTASSGHMYLTRLKLKSHTVAHD
jgi:hypothetical protein